MPLFPTRESAIEELVMEMLAGFEDNPMLFPHADVAGLRAAHDAYRAAREDQIQKMGMAHIATEVKYEELGALVRIMRVQLRQAQVDADSNPQRLSLVGWGPRAHRTPVEPPAGVDHFDGRLFAPGEVRLSWRPAGSKESGGAVRTYEVERRQEPPGGGEFSKWVLVGSTLTPKITLYDQPEDVRMEYVVFAVNHGGRSQASSTVVL